MKNKEAFLISTILVFFLFSNIALAEHSTSIVFSPDTWEIGEEKSVTITISNLKTSRDNIVKVELSVPLDEKNVSIYKVRNEVILPSGWEYVGSIRDGSLYLLTFSAVDKDLAPGSSVKFILKGVTAPDKPSENIWTWKTTDVKNEIFADVLVIKAELGKLDYFIISEVPKEIGAGESFSFRVTAIETHNLTKTDYVGKVTFSSTDPAASFEQKTYTFVTNNNGTKTFTLTYNTQGEQTLSIKDVGTGIITTSPKSLVKPPVPKDLSISINNGAPLTSSTEVLLNLSAARAEKCRYSNDGLFWTDYESYSTSKKWTLPAGDGTKTIYYQCKNSAGESEVVSDTIELRTLPVAIPTGLFGLSIQTVISGAALFIAFVALVVAVFGIRAKPKKKELT